MKLTLLKTRIQGLILTALQVCTAIGSTADAAEIPNSSLDSDLVTVPIPSIKVDSNNCVTWTIQLTYTATPLPQQVLSALDGMKSFSHTGHYHADHNATNGQWETKFPMSGDRLSKLSAINTKVFGRPNPAPGITATFAVEHQGACAADLNMRECVGIFVHATNGVHITPTRLPTTLPAEVCLGVPPSSVSCQFETSTAYIDLGTGGAGPRSGSTMIKYSCSRATTFRVQTLSAGEDDSGITVDGITIDGQPLPYYGSTNSNSPHEARLAVTGSVTGEGHLVTNRILRIDVP